MTAPTEPLARKLAEELGAAATVDIDVGESGTTVTVTPADPAARDLGWNDFDGDVVLQVGTNGGRWLLEIPAELDFMTDIVRSVIDGRVVEVFARGRSSVTVTLADGTTQTETGYEGLAGCLPLPFWRRWSRTVRYAPYRKGVT